MGRSLASYCAVARRASQASKLTGIGLISETIATLPGGWDLAHAIRLGIKPFAELGANSEAFERVPSRFSLFLPSDLRIGPGSNATVSICLALNRPVARGHTSRSRSGSATGT